MTGHSNRADGPEITRRGLLGAAAGAAASATLGAEARAQAETYRFGGEVAAWRGRAPAVIEGEDNPTLELAAGTEYEVVWENLDGAPHNFTIQDENGAEIVATDTFSEEGATHTLTFTATAEMARYICTIHPTTMVGDVEVSGGEETGDEEAGGTGDLSMGALLLVAALFAAVLSPLAFAVFLYLNRRRGEGRTAPRLGD